MAELKNNVKRFRVRKAFTQEQLASKANCSRQLISLIERRKVIPSISVGLIIANILEISLSELFFSLKNSLI